MRRWEVPVSSSSSSKDRVGGPRSASIAGFAGRASTFGCERSSSLYSKASTGSSKSNEENNAIATFSTGPNNHSITATGTDDSESWIMDFGMSANVNDDLRRTIRAEIEDIDASIQQIQVGIQNEQRTAEQLAKDASHAHAEMASHQRGAAELMDSASMNEHIRLNLEKTLQDDLIQPLSEKFTNASTSKENVNHDRTANAPETGGGNRDDEIRSTTKKFLHSSYEQCKSLLEFDKDTTLVEAQAQCKLLREKIASIEQTIASENLYELLEQKEEEARSLEKDLQGEVVRKETLEAAIEQSKRRCDEYDREIENKQNTLGDNKKKHEAAEDDLRKQMELAEAELQALKSTEAWDAEIAALEEERKAATQRIAEAETMIEKLKMTIAEREAVEDAVEELKTTEKETLEKVAALQKRVEEAEKGLGEAKKNASEAGDMKRSNDQFETEKVVPARARLKEAINEKEQLVQCINDARDSLTAHSEQVAAEEQEREKDLKEFLENIRKVENELAEVASEENEFARSMEEAEKAFEKEIQDLEALHEKLLSETKSEQARLDQEKEEDEMKMEKARDEMEEAIKTNKGLERHKAVLEMGVELLKATEKSIETIRGNKADGGRVKMSKN